MTKKRSILLVLLIAGGAAAAVGLLRQPWAASDEPAPPKKGLPYRPVQTLDTGGTLFAAYFLKPWQDGTSLEAVQQAYDRLGYRTIDVIDRELARGLAPEAAFKKEIVKTSFLLFEGESKRAYELLAEMRRKVAASDGLSARWLYTVIYFQGVVGLRQGEDENCVACRGESSCIFPLQPAAVHANPQGSRRAIRHFSEYLEQFPDDEGVRWPLNLACLTLGEHPHAVPARWLLTFDGFGKELDIGRFRDISHLVGVNRLNMAGGAIMVKPRLHAPLRSPCVFRISHFGFVSDFEIRISDF